MRFGLCYELSDIKLQELEVWRLPYHRVIQNNVIIINWWSSVVTSPSGRKVVSSNPVAHQWFFLFEIFLWHDKHLVTRIVEEESMALMHSFRITGTCTIRTAISTQGGAAFSWDRTYLAHQHLKHMNQA